MSEKTNPQRKTGRLSTLVDRVAFRTMSFIHEDVYRVVRDPYAVLYAAGLEGGQTVLEVGCGPGFFTIPAARIVGESGRVYALDINPLAIEKVQNKVREASLSNVETILADAARTELPEQTINLAFLFGLRCPVGGLGGIWTELHRLLEPDGILAVEGLLEPASELFSAVGQYGRINVFKKTGGQAEGERVNAQAAESAPTQRRCRRTARRRRWH